MTNTYLLVCCIENAIGLSELNGRVGMQIECNFSFFSFGGEAGIGSHIAAQSRTHYVVEAGLRLLIPLPPLKFWDYRRVLPPWPA